MQKKLITAALALLAVASMAQTQPVQKAKESAVRTSDPSGRFTDAPVQEQGAQPTVARENEVFTMVEEMPGFPGGEEALYAFLSSNIKYPEMEQEAGIQGMVYVRFVIETDGSVTNANVIRGVPDGPGLGREALRVVSLMPKWSPGKQQGKNVRVQFNLPIRFRLAEPPAPKD